MSLASSLQVCIDMDSTNSDQHHQWLQATMHENALMDASAISSPQGTDILGPSQILMSDQRRLRPPQDQALKCPRCDSTHTKFCYYNNYSLSQPRYFCKTCRRYWTKGGTLRNIPVGGGYRKNRKSSSSTSSNKKITTNEPLLSVTSSSIINNQSPSPSPSAMMMMSLANPVDLQLSFPFSQLHNNMMISSSGYNIGGVDYTEREGTVFNKSILLHHDMMSSSSRLIRPIDSSLCMEYKQNDVVEGAVAMNENMSKSNNYEGYISSNITGQFAAGGYDMHQNKVSSFADHLGRLRSCYIDENNNNNNTNDSVAADQYRHVADEYYSGGLLHEHHHHHNKDVISQMMQCEAKPNPKRLDLEYWQQEALGCPDANRFNSKEETYGGHDLGGSWWGSMSTSNAGNIYQHHQLLLPSATNSNNSLH